MCKKRGCKIYTLVMSSISQENMHTYMSDGRSWLYLDCCTYAGVQALMAPQRDIPARLSTGWRRMGLRTLAIINPLSSEYQAYQHALEKYKQDMIYETTQEWKQKRHNHTLAQKQTPQDHGEDEREICTVVMGPTQEITMPIQKRGRNSSGRAMPSVEEHKKIGVSINSNYTRCGSKSTQDMKTVPRDLEEFC